MVRLVSKINYRGVFIERQLQPDGNHLFICHTGISKFLPDLYETQDDAIEAVVKKMARPPRPSPPPLRTIREEIWPGGINWWLVAVILLAIAAAVQWVPR